MSRRENVRWDKYPEAIQIILDERKKKLSYAKIAILLNDKFDIAVDEHMVKRAYNKYKKEEKYEKYQGETESLKKEMATLVEKEIDEKEIKYKEKHQIYADGTHKSDKLLEMSAEQSKDQEYVMKAHGFDINEWDLVKLENNIWNVYSKQDGINTLYSSRLSVKPKVHKFSFEEFVEEVKKAKPIDMKIKKVKLNKKWLLEIPLFDQHFGISSYNYYKETQEEINDVIERRHWEEIVFAIGSDMFHNDDFRGRTSSGREIEQVDTAKAWADARTFFEPLIRKASKSANKVKIIFIKGNHDESMSWAFVQMLKARFPKLEYDDSFTERKIHVFGDNFIGLTHGDKAKKNLHSIFATEFPLEWARALTREIHTGHFHVEDLKDFFGTVVRTLATKNKTDKWHKDMGYVGAHKRFMLFEYNTETLKSVIYV